MSYMSFKVFIEADSKKQLKLKCMVLCCVVVYGLNSNVRVWVGKQQKKQLKAIVCCF